MLLFTMPAENINTEAPNADVPGEGLIAQIAGGSKEALAALYHQTKTAVYGFAMSILHNRQSAEDVMQDVYVRIYAAAPDYRPQGKPMAWILTIARNLALMKLRSEKPAEPLRQETWDPPDPRDPVAQSLNRLALEKAFSVLTQQERQIVMLHAAAGQKHREIAALLELPLSTTLSKYRRALSKLKKELREDEQDER